MERAKTSGRDDDNPETIKKRLDTFEKETLPIVKSFEERNNCIKVDATKTIPEVYKELQTKLGEVNVNPPAPVEMLFVLGGPGSGKGT
jgi:UMP-CMP kinase